MDVSQEFQRVRTYCILGVCVNVTLSFLLLRPGKIPYAYNTSLTNRPTHSSLIYLLLGTRAGVCLILESREHVFASAPGLGHTLKLLLVLSSSGWSLPMRRSMYVPSSPDGYISHPLRIVLQPAMFGT